MKKILLSFCVLMSLGAWSMMDENSGKEDKETDEAYSQGPIVDCHHKGGAIVATVNSVLNDGADKAMHGIVESANFIGEIACDLCDKMTYAAVSGIGATGKSLDLGVKVVTEGTRVVIDGMKVLSTTIHDGGELICRHAGERGELIAEQLCEQGAQICQHLKEDWQCITHTAVKNNSDEKIRQDDSNNTDGNDNSNCDCNQGSSS